MIESLNVVANQQRGCHSDRAETAVAETRYYGERDTSLPRLRVEDFGKNCRHDADSGD